MASLLYRQAEQTAADRGADPALLPSVRGATSRPLLPSSRIAIPRGADSGGLLGADQMNAAGGVNVAGGELDLTRLFDDPATRDLEDRIRTRQTQLDQPLADPQRQELINTFSRLRDQPMGTDESAMLDFGRKRFGDLQGDPFTGQEEKAMRVAALDRLERERAEKKRREADRLMRLGHQPSSGTVTAAMQEIDRSYDQARASANTDLLLYGVDERQRRQQEALNVGSFLTQQGRSREDREVGFATGASGAEREQRSEGDAREQEKLQVASLPSELATRRFQLAMQMLGMGGSAQGPLGALLDIGRQNTAANQATDQGWGQIAQLIQGVSSGLASSGAGGGAAAGGGGGAAPAGELYPGGHSPTIRF